MSIRLRLVLLYSGLLAALVTILCVSIYLFFARNLDEDVNSNLRSRTQAVLNTTVASQNFWGRLQLDLPANAFNGEPVYIQTVDCQGNPGPRSSNLGSNYLPISDAAIASACENKDGLPTSTTLNNGTELRMLVSPIRIRNIDTIIGVIVVAQAMAPLKATLRNLAIVLITSGTAAVILSLLLGWFVTRRALQPITTITDTAHSIELSQDLSQRIAEPKVQDEVGQLADTFNRMLDRLQVAFTFQQRFVADSSHELRTPLTVIKGNASLLRMTDDPQEREESIRVIENEAMRMNRIVDDLLLLAQLDNPTAQVAQRSEKLRRTVELDTLLLDVFKQARLMAGSRRVSLGHEDSATVLGDSDQLKQLLLNLVDNAVKYTPEDGSITLSLYCEQGWAVVDVADTGVGISTDDLPHIWERFFRVDKARSRDAGGTGLGLPIVRSIAVAHGGDVAAYSQPGQGSTFRVWLPLASATHAEPTLLRGGLQANSDPPFSTNGHREDEPAVPVEQAVMMRQTKDLFVWGWWLTQVANNALERSLHKGVKERVETMGQTTKEKGKIRVMIVDDHAMVRQGLRGFLELQPNIEVVGEAVDGMDAVEKAQALRPNVVLMDLMMPRMDGAQATRAIRTAVPSTQVIVLTSFSEDEQVFASIKAGAAGYLMKDIQPTALAAAIEKVARGEPTLHPEIARKIMQELGTPPRIQPAATATSTPAKGSKELESGLTEREVEVLRLIARGKSNREIADELVLSEKTVKTHVSNILQKLHLSDRTKAALYAVRRRLVDVDKDSDV